MKIVIAIPKMEEYRDLFLEAAQGRAELVFLEPSALCAESLADADAVIGNAPVEAIRTAKELKWLQIIYAGVETYTGNPTFPGQVMLTNATGAFGGIIAEYVLAGILASYRRLFQYKDQQRMQLWKDAGSESMLMAKQALILGAGDIGEQTARRLKAFEASVTGIRRVVREKPECFDRMAVLDELDELLPEMDLVIGCLPKTPETIHILDERRLRRMKKGALIVNVGRGSLIETEGLVRVLEEGHLSGAVLDVTEVEPLPQDHPLWKMDQVLITPHVSGKSFGHVKQVEQKIISICCENLKRFLEGKPLCNRIDFESGYAAVENRGR